MSINENYEIYENKSFNERKMIARQKEISKHRHQMQLMWSVECNVSSHKVGNQTQKEKQKCGKQEVSVVLSLV